ncbi:hypothetical protein [Candidatus Epulonipiscium viviparus]|uniref:hypothetical protein n=1 Tax=Candidatus Epulonipiscium viviparus TaxID=420336 RepID=UPI0027381024|nr:hypothetical protein [Candidatus Epulopiscium viviparus]
MAKPAAPAATPMTTTSPEIMPDIPAANPEMVQITPLVKPERVQTTPLVKPEISGINLEDIIEFTNLIKGLIGDKSKSNDKKVDFQEILNIVSAVTKSDQTSENTTIDPKVVENANEIIRDLVSQKPVSAGANAENADCGCDKSGKTVDEQFSEAMNFLIKTFQNKKDVEPKEGDVGFLKDQINAKSGLDKKAEIETLIQTTLNKDNKKVDIELENLLKRIEAFKKANHMNAMQPKTERPEKIVGKYENNPVVIKDNNKTIEPHINIAVVPIEVGNIGIGDNKTINVEDNALVKKNLI